MLMKRIVLLCLVMFMAVGANAQSMYICTATNVNVRTGPGKNYSVATTGWGEPWQISKNDGSYSVVRFLGKKKNGYIFLFA